MLWCKNVLHRLYLFIGEVLISLNCCNMITGRFCHHIFDCSYDGGFWTKCRTLSLNTLSWFFFLLPSYDTPPASRAAMHQTVHCNQKLLRAKCWPEARLSCSSQFEPQQMVLPWRKWTPRVTEDRWSQRRRSTGTFPALSRVWYYNLPNLWLWLGPRAN